MINPFAKKGKTEEQIAKEQMDHSRQSELLGSMVHPQNVDEQMMIERNNQLAELKRWQQDRTPNMRNLFQKLSGYMADDSGNLTRVGTLDVAPLMSINGAYHLINFIETLDVNVMMSNYSEQRVNTAIRFGIGYPLIQFIKDNRESLGIRKKKGDLDYIYNLIINEIEPTYLRGLNAGERTAETKTYKVVRTEEHDNKAQKKSIF